MNLVNALTKTEKRDLRRIGYTVTETLNGVRISNGSDVNDALMIKRLGRRMVARLRALGISTVSIAT